MLTTKRPKKVTLVPKAWEVVSRAVEEGVGFGLNRAFKHVDNPSRELIAEAVEREVMNALSEVVKFDAD